MHHHITKGKIHIENSNLDFSLPIIPTAGISLLIESCYSVKDVIFFRGMEYEDVTIFHQEVTNYFEFPESKFERMYFRWLYDVKVIRGIDTNLLLAQGCQSLELIDSLSHRLSHLHIEDCEELKSIELSESKPESIEVKDCPNLTELNIDLSKCSFLSIQNCPMLSGKKYDLSNIKEVKIINSPNFFKETRV